MCRCVFIQLQVVVICYFIINYITGSSCCQTAGDRGALDPSMLQASLPALDREVLSEVRGLHRVPERRQKCANDAERQEDNLAKRISKKWNAFHPNTRSELDALRGGDTHDKVARLIRDAQGFGRWPLEHAPSEDSKREAERLLARRVAKVKAAQSLPPAALEELEALEASHRRSEDAQPLSASRPRL